MPGGGIAVCVKHEKRWCPNCRFEGRQNKRRSDLKIVDKIIKQLDISKFICSDCKGSGEMTIKGFDMTFSCTSCRDGLTTFEPEIVQFIHSLWDLQAAIKTKKDD